MVSIFQYTLLNESVQRLAQSWHVNPGQAARRIRDLPFIILSHEDSRGGGRGRPCRRITLDAEWRFWDKAGAKPLGKLVAFLRLLHALGEPFALGIPFTSALWRPFLHPEIRILAPPETYSIWVRLFAGGIGRLSVVVELLPYPIEVDEVDGLPVLAPPMALVDALQEFERVPNLNLLALADWIAHHLPAIDAARQFAALHGLNGDLSYLEDHRHRGDMRVLKLPEAREAHGRAAEMSRVSAGTTFDELLDREAAVRD